MADSLVLFRALVRIGKFGPDLEISRVFYKTDAKIAESLVLFRALERIGKFGPALQISRVFYKTDAKIADSLGWCYFGHWKGLASSVPTLKFPAFFARQMRKWPIHWCHFGRHMRLLLHLHQLLLHLQLRQSQRTRRAHGLRVLINFIKIQYRRVNITKVWCQMPRWTMCVAAMWCCLGLCFRGEIDHALCRNSPISPAPLQFGCVSKAFLCTCPCIILPPSPPICSLA